MDFQTDPTIFSRVEVSGWDAKEDFFVEKTNFDLHSGSRNEITLMSSLREGCVVFVRVLEPVASGGTFPIAYQTTNINGRDKDGRARITLERLRPRVLRDYSDLALRPAGTRVA
jgi:hypothetical protein